LLSCFAAEVSNGISAEVFGMGKGEFTGCGFSVAVGKLLAVVG
jgi:hypothetical protein